MPCNQSKQVFLNLQGAKTGKDNGYTMLFDIESFDYSYYDEGSEGLKVALVHHLVIIIFFFLGKRSVYMVCSTGQPGKTISKNVLTPICKEFGIFGNFYLYLLQIERLFTGVLICLINVLNVITDKDQIIFY